MTGHRPWSELRKKSMPPWWKPFARLRYNRRIKRVRKEINDAIDSAKPLQIPSNFGPED